MQGLQTWARDGVPDRCGAWLTMVARRTALNAMRRRQTLETKLPLLLEPEDTEMPDPDYLPATKADLLHRLGRDAEASDAYQAALALADNAAEQEFLAARVRSTRPVP